MICCWLFNVGTVQRVLKSESVYLAALFYLAVILDLATILDMSAILDGG